MDNHSAAASNNATEGSGDVGSTHNDDTPRQQQHANATSATTLDSESPTDPPARVVGPFAAMVDAFISSFRQASAAQNNNIHTQAQRQGSAADPPAPPLRQPQASPSIPNAESTEENNVDPASQAATDTHQTSNNVAEATDTSTTQQRGDFPPSNPHPPTPDPTSNNTVENNGTSDAPRTLFFRMPFLTSNGQSATLAFNPGPIPIPAHQPPPRPPYGPERPANLGPERGNGLASGFHLPTAPIFVPLGASPLPFSFIFDVQTNTAWPIAHVSDGPPGAMPVDGEEEPGFAAGPPFHVGLNISFGPPPQAETPDPERAARFVDSLEKADAELRERMAQLGMGAIGDYGGRQDNEGGEGALGCGICLDEYPSEDRPEWIGGQASKDEEVVAVPCAGHHTLHRLCMYVWLSKKPPSEWTCPFCRAGLDKAKVESSAHSNLNDDVKKAEQEAKARSLREEVRLREKARGWRCDSPACLLRYPSKDATNDHQSDELVPLLPCRHKIHLDCLCTSMRLEQLDAFDADCEEEEEEDDDEEQNENDAVTEKVDSSAGSLLIDDLSAKNTVGKWVTCPTCRGEAWAELPIKKKRAKRSDNVKEVDIDQGDEYSVQQQSQREEHWSNQSLELPLSSARERAKLQDMQRSTARLEDVIDEDSDGAVETILL